MRYVMLLLALGLLAVPAFAANGNVNVSAYDDVESYSSLGCGPEDTTEAGAVPGDFTYGFKRFFENVDKFFTFDKAEQAKKSAKYGKLRSVEAHVMTCKAKALSDEGDEESSEQAMEQAQELVQEQEQEMEQAQEQLQQALDEGSADEADVEEVQNYTRNSIAVLQRVYEKAPESAKDGLLRALNNSINNYERHMEKVQQKLETKNKGNEIIKLNEVRLR